MRCSKKRFIQPARADQDDFAFFEDLKLFTVWLEEAHLYTSLLGRTPSAELDISVAKLFVRSHLCLSTGMHFQAFCLLLLTASACLLVAVEGNSDAVDAGDFWDIEEQIIPTQSEPVSPPEATKPQQPLITEPSPDVDLLSEHNQSLARRSSRSTILGSLHAAHGSYYVEGVFALIAAWFIAGIFTGKESNNKIVRAWVDANLGEGAVLEKNFAQLGPGEGDSSQLMMRESPKLFKLWASGRRHCQVSVRALERAVLLLRKRAQLTKNLARFNPESMHSEVDCHS